MSNYLTLYTTCRVSTFKAFSELLSATEPATFPSCISIWSCLSAAAASTPHVADSSLFTWRARTQHPKQFAYVVCGVRAAAAAAAGAKQGLRGRENLLWAAVDERVGKISDWCASGSGFESIPISAIVRVGGWGLFYISHRLGERTSFRRCLQILPRPRDVRKPNVPRHKVT